jgi:uncharacterized protein YegJ (DUF2314 family)
MRVVVIALISFVSLFFYLGVLHFVLPETLLPWISIGLAWGVTPMILLSMWKVRPSLEVLPAGTADPEMRAAREQARSELPRFFTGLESGRKDAFIKYAIHTRNDTTEHVWALAHRRDGECIVAGLVSTPVREIEGDEESDLREHVAIADIEDWMLVDGAGRVEGGYTHLAMVQIYRRIYGTMPSKRQLRQLDTFVDIHPRQYARA